MKIIDGQGSLAVLLIACTTGTAVSFVVRDGRGAAQPHGDLSPKLFRFQRGRCLGGLLPCEAGI